MAYLQEDEEIYYYGIIKEILELEYPGDPLNRIVLFNYHWFDDVINRGVKVHKEYRIVEIRHNRRYSKYDPFILLENAIQVYYLPYLEGIRDQNGWWVVIKTKARGTVDDRYTLDVAFQEEITRVDFVTNDDALPGDLRDDNAKLEEVEEGPITYEDGNEVEVEASEGDTESEYDDNSESDNEDSDQLKLSDDDAEDDDEDEEDS